VLQTSPDARPGIYLVTMRSTSTAAIGLESRYVLDRTAPLLEPEPDFPAPISVSESIAPALMRVYLPFVVR
ncbi:hypothetical protein, partial [Candidatus Viridilinea mediisalina]